MKYRLVKVLAIAALLTSPNAALGAQECPYPLGMSCSHYVGRLATGNCIAPGSVFMHDKAWTRISSVETARQRIGSPIKFFYAIDGRKNSRQYSALFVGMERITYGSVSDNVILSKNADLNFKIKEEKTRYSNALAPNGFPPQGLRAWGNYPEVGSIFFSPKSERLSELDFPNSIDDRKSEPHARLYRFETSSISCIPFEIDLTEDTTEVRGSVVEVYSATEKKHFRVIVK